MKILIVMSGFFPGKKYGGPPVSIDNFCSLMSDYECYVVTHDHDLFETEKFANIHDGWNDRGNCKVLYLNDEEYGKIRFKKTIEEIHPDILYLQGLFQGCVLPCLQLAKKYHIGVLLAPRGELCSGALSIKKWKKIPYIYGIKILGLVKDIHFQSTSDEETEAIAKWLKAPDEYIHRLDNIPSIPSHEYSRRKKTAGEGRFVFLSRIHPKKNLLSAIKYFHDVKGKVIFDIYGSIEDEEYWKHCQEEIERLPDNVKAEYKGLLSHAQVHEAFSQYDAFLFPTLSENYGHVIAESLVVGTPVIISDQTPWSDVNEAGAGWAIPLLGEEMFVEAIQNVIDSNNERTAERGKVIKNYIFKKLDIEGLHVEYKKTIQAL